MVQEGVAAPKPLVKVGGEMLIDRLIRVFMDNNASEICVICNEQMTAVAEHLKQISEAGRVPLKYTVKSTPSSMHSMWELSKWLVDEAFILTTVDTIFRESEFKVYANTFQLFASEGVVDGLDTCDNPKYISGGIYGLTPKSLDTLRRCIERGDSRMRNFQRALVSDGLKLKAYGFSKVLDIDHASDIQKAEDFLKM